MTQPNATHRHALPWNRDEFISIDGTLYCYTIGDGGITVHLPGGAAVSLDALRECGVVIIPPTRWRTEWCA